MMQRVEWSPDVALSVAKSAGNDLKVIESECQKGIAQVWAMSDESSGYVVTRLEADDSGRELVIVLGEGTGARAGIEDCKRLAQMYNATSIRTHITRMGLQRMYEKAGFYQSEIVMRFDCGQ